MPCIRRKKKAGIGLKQVYTKECISKASLMKTPRRKDGGVSSGRFIILKIPPCPPFPKWGWRKPHSPESFRDGVLKTWIIKNLPFPLFAKEGHIASLWQREVRRDFIDRCLHAYDRISKIPESLIMLSLLQLLISIINLK